MNDSITCLCIEKRKKKANVESVTEKKIISNDASMRNVKLKIINLIQNLYIKSS